MRSRRIRRSYSGLCELILTLFLLAYPCVILLFGLNPNPGQQIRRVTDRCASLFRWSAAPASHGGVLVVTANESDQFDVAAIVGPRGYEALRESTAEQGIARLRDKPGEFKVVVVNGGLPGSGAMVRTIRQSWPDKHVILLTGPRQRVRLAQSLLNAL